MKLTKRLAALALCLCLLCGIPLSVSAADHITMEKAVLFSTTATHATFEVTFSDMVTFPNNGKGWSMMTTPYNSGCTSASTFQSWTAAIEYVGNTVTEGTATYSKTVLMTFQKCQQHAGTYATTHPDLWGADGATMPANLYITSTVNDSQGATAVSSDIVKGMNGETLKWTKTQGAYAWAAIQPTIGDFTSMITLKKAAVVAANETGFVVEATFSAPVTINKQVWVMGAPQQGGDSDTACQNYSLQSTEYVGSDNGYSSVVRLTYNYCAKHKDLWVDSENGGYKVPDSGAFPNGAYLFVNDFGNNPVAGSRYMSTEVICGENNTPVLRTHSESTYGELYAKLVDDIPEPLPDPVTLTDVAIDENCTEDQYGHRTYTAMLTFSDYVHVAEGKGGLFCLRLNKEFDDAASNFVAWGSSSAVISYGEDTIVDDGITYGKTVKVPFVVNNNVGKNGLAAFISNNENIGIRIHDLSYRSGNIDFITDRYDRTLACSTLSVGYDYVWMTCNDNGEAAVKNFTLNTASLNASGTTLKVPAGMTLDLNGKNIDADSVMVYGTIKDSQQGVGVVKATTGLMYNPAATNSGVMPLYDSEAQGYRLFDVTVKHATKTVDGAVKFGMAIVLGGDEFSTKAYTLLQDSANADVVLTFELSITGVEPISYVVNADVLTDYADRLLADNSKLNSSAIVLTVYGIEEMSQDMTLACTPTLTSGTLAIAAGSTLTYTA